MENQELQSLKDDELRARLSRMALTERRVSAQLLRHLAEYDRRKLYRSDHSGSLWNYCAKTLKFPETEIRLRIQAARAIRDNQKLMDMLERGETTVSSIGRLAPHLNGDKAEQLIDDIRGMTRREVEWLVAKESAEAKAETRPPEPQQALFETPTVDEAAIREELRDRRDKIVPLSGEEAEIRFVATREFVERLERAQVLLARRHPKGALREVLGDALDLLLEKEDPARRTARREAKKRTAGERALRDEVLKRDGYRCVAPGCGERRWLELDHIVPVALGGKTTLANLRTYCRRHNQEAAIAVFGAANVAAAIRAGMPAARR